MISKWQCKIKKFNAKTVVPNLHGPQKSKNSINKKASMHHFAVKIVEQKLVQTSMVEAEAAGTEVQDNLFQ